MAPVVWQPDQRAYVIELQDADDVTLEHLAITGGVYGIYVAGGSDSDRLTLTHSDIYGNYYAGLYLGSSNENALLSDNRFHHQVGTGIHVEASGSTITGNTVFNQERGISVSNASGTILGNDVYNNSYGIGGYGDQAGNLLVIRDNTVHDNVNVGIGTGGGVLITGNTVYGRKLSLGPRGSVITATAGLSTTRSTTTWWGSPRIRRPPATGCMPIC
jgi:parallel beta-helix repeat protein